MKKNEFLEELKTRLWAMPEADKERSVDYYSEMIDDRMEDGLSEEEAVAAIGDLDEIVSQILSESPRPPSAAGTVISVYVSLWSVVIALYATTFALFVAALGCVLGSFFMIGGFPQVSVAWGAALLCAGLGILFLLLSNLAAKGMVKLTKLIWKSITGIFKRKERSV